MIQETWQDGQYTIEAKAIVPHSYATFGWEFEIKVTITSQRAFSVILKHSGHFQKGDEVKAFEIGKRAIHYLINSSTPLEDEYCCSWDSDGLEWEDCNDPLYKRN